jgi:hypothetical protein
VREAYAQRDRLAAALYAGLVEQARVSEDDHGSGWRETTLHQAGLVYRAHTYQLSDALEQALCGVRIYIKTKRALHHELKQMLLSQYPPLFPRRSARRDAGRRVLVASPAGRARQRRAQARQADARRGGLRRPRARRERRRAALAAGRRVRRRRRRHELLRRG